LNYERANGTVLSFIAFFLARGPENFTAFTAFVDIIATAVPDLAAAAFAAAGALAPCITAAMAWFVFTWHGRIAGLRILHGFLTLALLRILHGLPTLALLRTLYGLLTLARLATTHRFFLLAHFAITVGHHITTLFTPEFAQFFHLIRMIRNLKWQGRNYLPISTYL
jgi:hypothetical protein